MKKLFYLFLWLFLALGIFGCGDETKDKELKDNSTKNEVNDNNVKEEVSIEKKTYYCEEKDDDDWYYYFYYENDELVRTKILAAKWSGVFEEYSGIKSEAEKYNGVTISKDSDYVYYDIDMINGGLKYLTEMFWGFESLKEDISWENVQKAMESIASQCELK